MKVFRAAGELNSIQGRWKIGTCVCDGNDDMMCLLCKLGLFVRHMGVDARPLKVSSEVGAEYQWKEVSGESLKWTK